MIDDGPNPTRTAAAGRYLGIYLVCRLHGAAGARNHCVHGSNQIIVEDVLDMRPYNYFTVSHTPQGLPTSLHMTFRFQSKLENQTHFTLTFKAHIPYMPEWFKRQFCLFILRTQVFKLWKLEMINHLIEHEQG